MSNILADATRHAKAKLFDAGIEVGYAKLQEVLAALLGYQTYRAFKHEENDQELDHHLSDAEFIILHQDLGKRRAAELFEFPGEVLPKCTAALEECLPTQVLRSVDAYLERHGMSEIGAALTNHPPHGLHVEPEWSSRYQLSQRGYFSSYEPIWEVRRSWHVQVEVLMQSIAPGAELHEKINVLLSHAKAGRSGLILRGVKPVEEITAVIESMRVDQLVRGDEGSAARPWVAVVLHTPSGTVLGNAVSLADNLDLLEANALADALRSTTPAGIDESSKCLPYHITRLQIDNSVRSNLVIRMAETEGIYVAYNPHGLIGVGAAERKLRMIMKELMKPVPYSRKSKSGVISLAAFTSRVQKYCEMSISRN